MNLKLLIKKYKLSKFKHKKLRSAIKNLNYVLREREDYTYDNKYNFLDNDCYGLSKDHIGFSFDNDTVYLALDENKKSGFHKKILSFDKNGAKILIDGPWIDYSIILLKELMSAGASCKKIISDKEKQNEINYNKKILNKMYDIWNKDTKPNEN